MRPPRLALAALMLSAPLTSGCMYFDINAGYYFPSAKKPSELPTGTTVADPAPKAGFGMGIAGGIYYDIGDTGLKVAAGARADAAFITAGGNDDATTNSGPEVRLEYNFADSYLAALAVSPGTATIGGQNATGINLFGGAGVRDGDEEGHFVLAGGVRYLDAEARNQTTGTVGALSMWGPEARLTFAFDLTADSGSSGGGGSGDPVAWVITFDDSTNIIPALGQGASRRGCAVKDMGDRIVCDCSEGQIIFLQKGRELLIACAPGVAESTCRGMAAGIAEAAK